MKKKKDETRDPAEESVSDKPLSDEGIDEAIRVDEEIRAKRKSNANGNVRRLMIDEFLGSYARTSGKYNTGASGFKMWWTVSQKRDPSARMVMDEWIEEYDRFMSSPTKKRN